MVTCAVSEVLPSDAVSDPWPGGRWFKSNPRHQNKDKESDNAPLRFLG